MPKGLEPLLATVAEVAKANNSTVDELMAQTFQEFQQADTMFSELPEQKPEADLIARPWSPARASPAVRDAMSPQEPEKRQSKRKRKAKDAKAKESEVEEDSECEEDTVVSQLVAQIGMPWLVAGGCMAAVMVGSLLARLLRRKL